MISGVDEKATLTGLCASDGRINANTTVRSVSGNSAPTAAPESYSVTSGRTLGVLAPGVLGNDADPESDPMTAVLQSGPAHASSFTLEPGGAFTYTPAIGYVGTDSFRYSARDDAGLTSASVTVTIVVTPPPVPVYRFYNGAAGTHFYTASEAEKNTVVATLSHIFALEGVAYRVNPATNITPLFRFFKPSSGTHFYTASVTEKNNVIANLSSVYTYEGPAYNVSSTSGGGAKPAVYRFFNMRNGTHFYTASAAEKATVQNTLSHIYSYEGPAFYLGQ